MEERLLLEPGDKHSWQEISRDQITLGEVLGEGQFCKAYKSTVTDSSGKEMTCAAKMLKSKYIVLIFIFYSYCAHIDTGCLYCVGLSIALLIASFSYDQKEGDQSLLLNLTASFTPKFFSDLNFFSRIPVLDLGEGCS